MGDEKSEKEKVWCRRILVPGVKALQSVCVCVCLTKLSQKKGVPLSPLPLCLCLSLCGECAPSLTS